MAKARHAAKANAESISRRIANRLVEDRDEAWPQEVLKAAGAIPDFPDLTGLRKGYGPDSPRETGE